MPFLKFSYTAASNCQLCRVREFLENVTIQCFRLTFQFGTGGAAFGGLLKFGESVLWIFVSIHHGELINLLCKSKATDSTCTCVKIRLKAKYVSAAIVLLFTVISPLALLMGGLISISIVSVATLFRDIVYIVTVFLIAFYIAILVCLAPLLPERKSFDPEIILTGARAPQQHSEEVPATNTDCPSDVALLPCEQSNL